jgi:hypothetical protein
MTDTFHNPLASSVTARLTYTSFLGSYGAGVIYPPAGAPLKALTVWDGMGKGRDAGFVFGAADASPMPRPSRSTHRTAATW